MRYFKHISLFSGIGGFDLAAEWMGWQNVAHCEINEFCRTVLKYYWPNAISYEDITKTDFSVYRGTIDIVTGGFPCQPYSVAGKQKGTADERHLWPEMLRAIREIQPRWIVGENVHGLVSWNGGLVFEQVQADLENEGYEVQPFLLPAASVNAPHKRNRIWFVAYSNNKGRSSGLGEVSRTNGEISKRNENTESCNSNGRSVKNSNSNGRECKFRKEESDFREFRNVGAGNNEPIQANNDEIKSTPNTKSQQSKRSKSGQRENSEQEQRKFRRNNCENDCTREVYFDGESIKLCKCGHGNNSTASNANSRRQSGKKYGKKESRFFTKKSIPDNWENFPTQSPICDGNDGISERMDLKTVLKAVGRKVNKLFKPWNWWRNESIKAGGNAVVPQVVLQIFKAIEQYENET